MRANATRDAATASVAQPSDAYACSNELLARCGPCARASPDLPDLVEELRGREGEAGHIIDALRLVKLVLTRELRASGGLVGVCMSMSG